MRHPTLQRLRSLLHYDPDTGRWTWVVDRGGTARTGKEAGYIHSFSDTQNQRRVLKIDGVFYRASRLAWFYMTGQWPKNLIDHKNGDTLDDRWENSQTSHSLSDRCKPKTFEKQCGRFQRSIQAPRSKRVLGPDTGQRQTDYARLISITRGGKRSLQNAGYQALC